MDVKWVGFGIGAFVFGCFFGAEHLVDSCQFGHQEMESLRGDRLFQGRMRFFTFRIAPM